MQVHEMIRNFFPEYYSIERYPADQTVCIRKTKDEWGVFGNFYMTPIVVNGVTFDCTERLFHLMKFKPDATEGIREQMDVQAGQRIKMHMRSIYRNHPEWLHDHWPTMVVDAMKYCLTLKYEQCELFRNELQRSSGMFIVEDETARKLDTWGAVLLEEEDEYVGPNLLGRLLMELRDNGKLEYTLPDDALDFINVLK